MRKQVFLVVMVLVLAVGLAWSGEQKGQVGTMSPAEKAAKLQEKLGLTDAQTGQVQAVFEQTHEKISALKASGADEVTIKDQKTKIKAEQNDKLKAILTAEQWAKYQELMAEHHKQKK